jgi:NADH-quinone oxidoreductase subunit A
MDFHLSNFATVLLFLITAVFFLTAGFITAWLIRPNRPNEEKLSTYESGEDTVGSAWTPFNARFYVLALVFILFEVEILFLFPWSVVFGQADLISATNGLWAKVAITEMFLFIGILLLGLAYVWAKGYLDWAKPDKTDTASAPSRPKIPREAYQHYLK